MSSDLLQPADFSSEHEVTRLRELARNGSVTEAHMYGGYSDGTSHAQPSGLSNEYTDLDSAALLESLAEFNTPANHEPRGLDTNDHFASLLEAAATAGGQELARVNRTRGRGESQESHDGSNFFQRSFPPESRSKRKRNISEDDDSQEIGLYSNKRRKKPSMPEDPALLARQEEIWGPEEGDNQNIGDDASMILDRDPIPTAEARAAGVHSAAALFRRPTAASKKYTRPPMSKLFLSLELDPEDFLHLQAAAKEYMLDPRYPERSECVGSKLKGDTDITKLKLFGCVKAFLEDGGWGERYFVTTAEGEERKKNKWPEHKTKIISLVTPLMRRMVTNERQRLYAVETRNEQRKSKVAGRQRNGRSESVANESTRSGDWNTRQSISISHDHVDPNLERYHYGAEQSIISDIRDSLHTASAGTTDGITRYHINIMQNNRRLKPRYSLPSNSCHGFSSLLQSTQAAMDDSSIKLRYIKVLGPAGLVEVKDDDGWRCIVAAVAQNEWMDGEVRCLVEIENEI